MRNMRPPRPLTPEPGATVRSPLPRSPFPAEVDRIADELLHHQVRAKDGSRGWIGATGYGTAQFPLRVRKLSPHLYHGSLGICLFLAAVAATRRRDELTAAVLPALEPIRRKIRELTERPESARNLQLGGLIGAGSLIYGLLRIGEFLGIDTLGEEASAAAVLITQERIHQDERVWVQIGCAGSLLALLALHRRGIPPRRGTRSHLDRARDCGERILAARTAFEELPRAWRLAAGKPPLIGFGYGAAGICYALLRLYEATEEEAYRAAAGEGLAFLDTLYRPQQGGWGDIRMLFQSRYQGPVTGTWKEWWTTGGPLRPRDPDATLPPVETACIRIWCHGSSGIALSRLAGLSIDPRPQDRQQIDNALDHLGTLEEGVPDDLCCGGAGMIDVLVSAAARMGHPQHRATASTLATALLDRVARRGGYRLSAARGTDAFAPTLFQGLAGVGYTLLRLDHRETVPSLLLLE
jgi:lantibiotic modifying enzyme